MKMKMLVTGVLSLLYFSALTQNSNYSCSGDTLYNVLDFWVGDWVVYDSTETQIQGYNLVSKILKDCAITEEWRDASGGEGRSLFYVDNSTHRWKQVWVTEAAKAPLGQKEKTLTYFRPGEQTIFQGQYEYRPHFWLLDRTILTKLSDQKVRQEIQISPNGGLSWRTGFVGIYVRKN